MAFDIREQTDRASAVTPESVELDAFDARPLSVPTLRCLRYMTDIERYTVRYLRDLLVTPSHTDPVVTEFLTGWAFQQYWLGETLDAVLHAHNPLPSYPRPHPGKRLAREIGDRLAPIRHALVTNLIGEDFVALHMSWGAITEWIADVTYERIADHEGHPELTAALHRIQRQKKHHAEFYEAQAQDRLSSSRRAKRLTRFALEHVWFWYPAGMLAQPENETRFVVHYLLDGASGLSRIRELDRKAETLPGQAGLELVSTIMARYGVGTNVVSRR